jgi:hypothetical protein
VPATFVAADESANGDGRGFRSADGAAEVLCYGANSQDETVQQGFDDAIQFARDAGNTISYSGLSADKQAFTMTGLEPDGTIFYQHTVWGRGSNDTVYWTYPQSLKEQLDSAVQHSVQTLQAGDLTTSH